jgi:hypothetical protein
MSVIRHETAGENCEPLIVGGAQNVRHHEINSRCVDEKALSRLAAERQGIAM